MKSSGLNVVRKFVGQIVDLDLVVWRLLPKHAKSKAQTHDSSKVLSPSHGCLGSFPTPLTTPGWRSRIIGMHSAQLAFFFLFLCDENGMRENSKLIQPNSAPMVGAHSPARPRETEALAHWTRAHPQT